MKFIQKKDKLNQELSQNIVRVILGSLLLIYTSLSKLLFENYSIYTIVFESIFVIYAIYNFHIIRHNIGKKSVRILFNIFTDISLLSSMFYINGQHSIVAYPLLLWVIVGYGMRFGPKYLFLSLAYSEITFSLALFNNPAWNDDKNFIFSLSLALMVISLVYIKFIKDLHHLNNTLEEKVKSRVEEIEYNYLHDPLTNLRNRYALEQDLNRFDFSMLMLIDIDNFHNYNELYGIKNGNLVLIEFASWLQGFANSNNFDAYRLYGDIFVLRCRSKYTNNIRAYENIEKIFQELKNFSIELSQYKEYLEIDLTIGLSLEKEHVLKKAEMALKHAKRRHKKYLAYSKSIDNSSYSHELISWKNRIKRAIESDNIVPVYQAIVDRDKKILKYESLMRLQEKDGNTTSLISPFSFLEVAIKSKLYPQLTEIMIDKTLRDMTKNNHKFSLNLTFQDMINKDMIDILKQCIKRYNIGSNLIFEIVESEDINDFEYAKRFVHEFKAYGVEIAIDDFGTGYSNFSHICELEPNYLKIDGSLIKNIDHDKQAYELVKSIVSFSKTLGIKTIAEFVSKKEIFDICYDLGIDQFQGYYFSKPLLFEELNDLEERFKSQLTTKELLLA